MSQPLGFPQDSSRPSRVIALLEPTPRPSPGLVAMAQSMGLPILPLPYPHILGRPSPGAAGFFLGEPQPISHGGTLTHWPPSRAEFEAAAPGIKDVLWPADPRPAIHAQGAPYTELITTGERFFCEFEGMKLVKVVPLPSQQSKDTWTWRFYEREARGWAARVMGGRGRTWRWSVPSVNFAPNGAISVHAAPVMPAAPNRVAAPTEAPRCSILARLRRWYQRALNRVTP
jgi:hypothetical protein